MMINGILIHNASLVTKKYFDMYDLYLKAANELNINLNIIDNREIVSCIDKGELKLLNFNYTVDFILFLDKDLTLARHLEKLGYKVFNSSKAIEICDSKIDTFQALSNAGIKMPKTIFAPKLFNRYVETDMNFIDVIEKELTYPLVIKEAFGSFGAQVYLINNRKELIDKRNELIAVPHLYQELIKASYGKDVRIQTVNHRVVASVLRTSNDDFRANASNGGKMQTYNISKEFEDMAIKVSKILDLDFAGIDILFDYNDEPILCEVNSNAHIKNLFEATNINVATSIFKYILEVIND